MKSFGMESFGTGGQPAFSFGLPTGKGMKRDEEVRTKGGIGSSIVYTAPIRRAKSEPGSVSGAFESLSSLPSNDAPFSSFIFAQMWIIAGIDRLRGEIKA